MIVKNIIIINGKEVDYEELSDEEKRVVSFSLNKKVAECMGFICKEVEISTFTN